MKKFLGDELVRVHARGDPRAGGRPRASAIIIAAAGARLQLKPARALIIRSFFAG